MGLPRCNSFVDNILHVGKGTSSEEDTSSKSVDAGGKSAKIKDKQWATLAHMLPFQSVENGNGCDLPFCRYQHCYSKYNSTSHKAINSQTNQQRQVGGELSLLV